MTTLTPVQNPAPARSPRSGTLTPGLLREALPGTFRKLDPRLMWRNPVMFVVEVGALLSTAIAIAKHLLDLLLGGEFHVLTQFRPEFCQPDLARGRQDGEPIALLVPDHDPLHQAVTRNVTSLGALQRRLSRLV